STDNLTYPLITVGIGWAIFLASAFGRFEGGRGTVAVGLIAALLVGAFAARRIDLAVARATGSLVALCLGALPWVIIWDLYLLGDHSRYLLLLMAVAWCGDTGGYFGGRFFGGKIFGDRKMAPSISPKKTW